MATGLRLGEAAGLHRHAVDLERGSVEGRATIVGLRRTGLGGTATTTDAGHPGLLLPGWCVQLLRQPAAHLDESDRTR